MEKTPQSRSDTLAKADCAETYQTADGLEVVVGSRLLLPNGLLEIRLDSAIDNGAELPLDDRYLFRNPPTMVPDGTSRQEIDPATGRQVTLANFVEDHEAALHAIVADAARHFATRGKAGNTTLTVFSTTADGHIRSSDAVYSTARSGGTLAISDVATTQTCGQWLDGVTSRIYETFLAFDTSSIPDDATTDSATLSLYGQLDQSTTDFTLQARLKDWGASLDTADWVAGASLGSLTLLATLSTVGFSTAAYNAFTENATNLRSNISKTGETRMILNSSRHQNSDAPTGSEYVQVWAAEEAGTTQDPKLVVNYTEISGGVGRRPLLGAG